MVCFVPLDLKPFCFHIWVSKSLWEWTAGVWPRGEKACTAETTAATTVTFSVSPNSSWGNHYDSIIAHQVEKNGIKEVRSSIKELMFLKSHFHGAAALNTKLWRRTGGELTQDHPKSLAPAIRTSSPRILIQGSTSSSQRSSLRLSSEPEVSQAASAAWARA